MVAPHICLDTIWREDWTVQEVPKFRALVAETHAGDAWISDGNFAVASFDLRLARADLVVWLERSRWLCAWRALGRPFKRDQHHGVRRIFHVLRFILNFDRINRPRIDKVLAEHGPNVPVIRLCSHDEEEAFLKTLSA